MYYPLQKELDDYYVTIIDGNNKRETTVKCKICKKTLKYLSFKCHYRRKHQIHYIMYLHGKCLFFVDKIV